MLEEAARLADDASKLERDGLEKRVDPLTGGILQGAQQPIAPPHIISLSFGHSGITCQAHWPFLSPRHVFIAIGG